MPGAVFTQLLRAVVRTIHIIKMRLFCFRMVSFSSSNKDFCAHADVLSQNCIVRSVCACAKDARVYVNLRRAVWISMERRGSCGNRCQHFDAVADHQRFCRLCRDFAKQRFCSCFCVALVDFRGDGGGSL